MKDGPMVANAGLVTETEVRREMTSLGMKAYEAWREGGGTERARERKEGFGGRDEWGGREERMGGRGRKEEGQGEKGTCKCTFLTNTNPKFQFKGTHNLRLRS